MVSGGSLDIESRESCVQNFVAFQGSCAKLVCDRILKNFQRLGESVQGQLCV